MCVTLTQDQVVKDNSSLKTRKQKKNLKKILHHRLPAKKEESVG